MLIPQTTTTKNKVLIPAQPPAQTVTLKIVDLYVHHAIKLVSRAIHRLQIVKLVVTLLELSIFNCQIRAFKNALMDIMGMKAPTNV